MSKKAVVTTQMTQDDFEAELQSKSAVFDQAAITIVKIKDRDFKIVKIPIDSTTLEVGKAEVVDTAEGKSEAVEKFKIAVARSGII